LTEKRRKKDLILLFILLFIFFLTFYKIFQVSAKELEGTILNVNGDIVEFNLGSKNGLAEGDEGLIRLSITVNGNPMVLDIAKIKIIKVKEDISKARITQKTSDVQSGYTVVFPHIEVADVPTIAPTPIELPTIVPEPTEIPTSVPVPTQVPTAVPVSTQVPTAVPVPTEIPTSVPVSTQVPTAMPVPTEIPTAVPVPTEIPTSVPVSTQVPTAVPTPTPDVSMAKVEINSEPTRARVYIDGCLVGRTPLKLKDIMPGTYIITVTTEDLMWEEQISLVSGNNMFEAKFRRVPYLGMIYIPAGEFVFGSDKPGSSDGPSTTVSLDSYYIDRCEVTMAEYAEFVRATGYKSQGDWEMYFKPGYENYPVVNVTWYDAVSYAEWVGKRLPTELEWEKAARGSDGRTWPWGNEWDNNNCNNTYASDPNMVALMLDMGKGKGPVPAGILEKSMSPYGVFDMAGNVEEWVYDWYNPYPYKPDAEGVVKSIRGGSWYHFQDYAMCYSRNKYAPDKGYNKLGFRCVKDF